MPFFRAEVIDAAGHTRTVKVEARDQRHAVERLNRKGLKPMALTEVADAPAPAPAPTPAIVAPVVSAPAPAPDVSALQAELAQLRAVQTEQLAIARKSQSFGSQGRVIALYFLIALVLVFVFPPAGILLIVLGAAVAALVGAIHGINRLTKHRTARRANA